MDLLKTFSDKLRDPQLQKCSGIYKIIVNGMIYVGSAVSLSARLRCHINDLKANRHRNIHLQRAFIKYGDIDFDIIEIVNEATQLITREQFYIDSLKPHYNICPTAGSNLGFKHSKESKELISRVQLGRKHSDEARKNFSLAKKGIKLSDSHKANLSKSKMGEKNPFYRAGVNHPQYGTKKSQETILKLSKDNNKGSNTGVLFDAETGANYVFRSLKSVCDSLGLPYGSMKRVRRQEKFYMGRYYASFMEIPKGHETTDFTNHGRCECKTCLKVWSTN